jgi:hypothetical protein
MSKEERVARSKTQTNQDISIAVYVEMQRGVDALFEEIVPNSVLLASSAVTISHVVLLLHIWLQTRSPYEM